MAGPYDCVDWRDRYSGFVYRIVEQNQGAARQFAMLMEALAHRYRSHDMGPSDVGRALSEMAPMVRELAELSAAHINQALQIRRQNVQNQFYIAPRDEADYAELRPRGPWMAVDPARDDSWEYWYRGTVSDSLRAHQRVINDEIRAERIGLRQFSTDSGGPSVIAQEVLNRHYIDTLRVQLEQQIRTGAMEANVEIARTSMEHQRRAEQEREAAEQKSRKTFLDACSPAQRTEFEHHRTIDVEVKLHPDVRRNGRYFLIKQQSFSVTNIRTGERFCAQIPGVPIYDQMLGLKLMLENDPVKFFEVANSNREITRAPPPLR